MMRMKPFPIRAILLLTISALTLIILLLASKELYANWRELAKIRSLKAAVVMSDQLFDATEKLAEERDIAYTVLHASDRVTIDSLQTRLSESGQAADIAFAATMKALDAYDFPEMAKLRDDMRLQLSGIQALRQQIVQAVAMPAASRDGRLSDQWFRESTGLIVQTQDLWVEFSKHFVDIDPVVTQHLRYKHFLRVVSDYTGRERAIIGRLIVENSDPTPDELSQLLRGQGVIELSWKFMAVLADQSGLYASIAPYYIDAKSHYQTLYGMTRDIFYVPGRHGVPSPISIDLWLELSAQARDSFGALKEVSLKEIRNYVAMLEMRAQQAIVLHALLLLFTLALCGYSFRVITRRVIRPINAMVKALLDATEGKPVTSLPPAAKAQDEIGKLARVLHAFQEAGERYRALIKASAQITWTWEPGETGQLDAFKDWWEETTGQPRDEILPFGWLEYVHSEDRERARDTWATASVEGKNFEMEYRVLARDGRYRWAFFRAVAIKRPDGSVREFVGSLNDVTERREAEATLLSYTQALERSNKELDDFAYIASHDLKEPLRGLFNHATFLLEDYKDKLDEKGVHKLHRLSFLSQRMERLVNDLLYFSRLGRQELAIQPTDMNEVVHDIANTLDVFIEERHAHIVIPKPLPVITCDKTRVTEALRNLITNAIKYNDKPEKTVEIGFLEHYPMPDGHEASDVFYVRDDGNGFAPEFYEEIFRIFKRLQGVKGTPEEGTGAGLTFVKKIIERHGGKIWPESQVGKGTSFYFTLR